MVFPYLLWRQRLGSLKPGGRADRVLCYQLYQLTRTKHALQYGGIPVLPYRLSVYSTSDPPWSRCTDLPRMCTRRVQVRVRTANCKPKDTAA